MPFVIEGDKSFALSHVLRPYPSRNLNISRHIYKYSLKHARRMVQCAFGILCNVWRIFHRANDVCPDLCDVTVKTCSILHNFVGQRRGFQSQGTLHEYPLDSIKAVSTRGNVTGTAVREYSATYFTSPLGCVLGQYEKFWSALYYKYRKCSGPTRPTDDTVHDIIIHL